MQPPDHFGHLLKMEGVDRIRLQVIVPVSEEGSVRDHDSPESMMPEGIVVRKINASEKFRGY